MRMLRTLAVIFSFIGGLITMGGLLTADNGGLRTFLWTGDAWKNAHGTRPIPHVDRHSDQLGFVVVNASNRVVETLGDAFIVCTTGERLRIVFEPDKVEIEPRKLASQHCGAIIFKDNTLFPGMTHRLWAFSDQPVRLAAARGLNNAIIEDSTARYDFISFIIWITIVGTLFLIAASGGGRMVLWAVEGASSSFLTFVGMLAAFVWVGAMFVLMRSALDWGNLLVGKALGVQPMGALRSLCDILVCGFIDVP